MVRTLPVVALTFLVAGAMPAQAYLDPGTGSIIAQAAIGAVVAAGMFFRAWWGRVRELLGLAKPVETADSEEQG
ncbi:MAG: hypothetical protein ACM3N5_01070 [Candidatus Eiseniibacteriota bacterium]